MLDYSLTAGNEKTMKRLLSFQRNHVLLPLIFTLYIKEIKTFLYVGALKVHETLYSTVITVRRIKWENSGGEGNGQMSACQFGWKSQRSKWRLKIYDKKKLSFDHSGLTLEFLMVPAAQSLKPLLFVTPWPVALQAPLSMEFSRQEY